MGRSPSPKKKDKKDKKEKKDKDRKKKTHSDESSDEDVRRKHDNKKSKKESKSRSRDRKDKHKSRKSRQKSKERDQSFKRKQSQSKDRQRRRERDQSKRRSPSRRSPSRKKRSNSPQKVPAKKILSEQEELRLKQKRLALAKMLLLEGDLSSDSEDQKENGDMKLENAVGNSQTAALINQSSVGTNIQNNPQATAPTVSINSQAAVKMTRWETSVKPAGATEYSEALESRYMRPKEDIPYTTNNASEDKGLSLDVGHSEDKDLFRSEDKDLYDDDHKQASTTHGNGGQSYNNNQNTRMDLEDDPLEAYMKEITGGAARQMDLPKKGHETIATFEDVLMTQEKYEDKSEDEEDFKKSFLEAIKNFNKEDKEKEVGQVMDDDDHRQDAQDFLLDNTQDLDYFAKQKKLAERKELGQVDHQKIQYEEVKFNFYREAEEIKALTPQEVEKYRKEAGDIKVRGKDIPNPVFNWYQCGFSEKVLVTIEKRGYKKPFPIQAQSFPIIMSGRDMIGIAETGSGKTMAYLLPLIRHVEDQKPVEQGEGPIAVILTPTRELARQVFAEAKAFCRPMNIRVLAVYGGLGVQSQLSDLKRGADVIVCTPGRMIDVLTLNNGKITNLRRVTMIVIDEADRMFDLGFEPQITKIINNVRPVRQTVMFSATFPKNVENLAKRILKKPAEIIVGSRGQACANITQMVEVRDETTKFLRLLELLGQWNDKGSILIFVDKQTEADLLFKQLINYGYYSLILHGAMDPTDREDSIYDFKKGVRNIMIATSVCARGLDIKSIVLVVNFKCPNHMEDYIHRIGRTGRAGNKGTAVTFITPSQQQYSIDIIKALELADIEPSEELKALSQSYLSKLSKGQARRIKNRNLMGSGFKFDEEEEEKAKAVRDIIKKQIQSQGFGTFSDSDQEDLQKQKKVEETKRVKNEQDKIAEAIKDPEIKQKLLHEAMKAVSDAIKKGVPMTTEKLLEIAVNEMKDAVSKHKVIRSVSEGVEEVTKLINSFQNKDAPESFTYDFQINDYPPAARQKVVGQNFLNNIKSLTNCQVSVRGTQVEPGKKVPAGQRKLYLHIRGENKHYVSSAYKEIKKVLQEISFDKTKTYNALVPGRYKI